MDEVLERIRAFVNTRDLEHGEDEIATPRRLAEWLRANELGSTRPAPADVEHAAAVREALRAHLRSNNGEALPAHAVAVLDRQAERSRLRLGFGAGGAHVAVGASGVDASLGALLADVHSAMADGSFARLKACRADDCQWAFLDASRNGSRQWCAMGVCGNRAKARRYRARHAGE